MEFAIRTHEISKVYPLYERPIDRFKEALHPLRKKYHTNFHALRNINMEIGQSECIGLVGMNGSGKSTLLQIIAGVVSPSQGRCEVNGRISALLELGAGFNPEATGIANVKFQCTLSGIDVDEQPTILDDILQFADIGQFVYQPVKTYSSGMFVRLAFATAISVNPDILIVDEALAVGDSYFQNKCLTRMQQFRESGKTLIFVSHDAATIKNICNRAYLLHKGEILSSGSPDAVFADYNRLLAAKAPPMRPGASANLPPTGHKAALQILDSRMKGANGLYTDTFVSGEKVSVELEFITHFEVHAPNLVLSIHDRMGNEIYTVNSSEISSNLKDLRPNNTYRLIFELALALGQDTFTLVIKELASDSSADPIIHTGASFIFRVILSPEYRFVGSCRLDTQVSFEKIPGGFCDSRT